MDVSLTDYALVDFGPPRRSRKGIGGPNSCDGKKTCSQNARKHGCRSKEQILPDERREDYEALWDEWLDQYDPEWVGDLSQIERIVDAAWRLRRTERAFTRVERALQKESSDPTKWSTELLARLQLMQRYRTTAENALDKAIRSLEFLKARRDAAQRRCDLKRELKEKEFQEMVARVEAHAPELRVKREEAEAEMAARPVMPPTLTPAEELFQGQNHVKPRLPMVWLEQQAEIRIVQGRTVTELFPSNGELIAEGQAMLPPPAFVYRRLNFPDGIPAEYAWVGVRDPKQRARGGSGLQKMTTDVWLEVVERETVAGHGHLLPAAQWKRPETYGLCNCLRCVKLAEILRKELLEERGLTPD